MESEDQIFYFSIIDIFLKFYLYLVLTWYFNREQRDETEHP